MLDKLYPGEFDQRVDNTKEKHNNDNCQCY